MTKPISIPAIEEATGKSWDEWLKFLDSINAKDLPHKEIADKVRAAGTPGWWAQSVTVAYEQHISRRLPGQSNDGTFSANASKTVRGTMDGVLESWLAMVKHCKDFDGVAVEGEQKISKTDKWRCNLADRSRIVVGIYQKTPDKAGLGLEHEKLDSTEAVEHWHDYWEKLLDKL